MYVPSPKRPRHPCYKSTQVPVGGKEDKRVPYLLNVIVAQCTSILQLFAREDQTLLVRRDAFFVLDLGFDVVDRI